MIDLCFFAIINQFVELSNVCFSLKYKFDWFFKQTCIFNEICFCKFKALAAYLSSLRKYQFYKCTKTTFFLTLINLFRYQTVLKWKKIQYICFSSSQSMHVHAIATKFYNVHTLYCLQQSPIIVIIFFVCCKLFVYSRLLFKNEN
jgi:hypothetical protein